MVEVWEEVQHQKGGQFGQEAADDHAVVFGANTRLRGKCRRRGGNPSKSESKKSQKNKGGMSETIWSLWVKSEKKKAKVGQKKEA